MSLPKFPENNPNITRDDVINQILSSIAMEELGLSHVINAEGEKLQYVLGTIPDAPKIEQPVTIDDLLAINKSVRETLDSTMQNQIFLRGKLQSALSAPTTSNVPFLSSYTEVLGNTQTVGSNTDIVFDSDSEDSVGNNIVLDSSGTTFTINRTGLYHIEWNLNLAASMAVSTPVVVGIIENGESASGTATSTAGNFSSGTLINVDTVPFTITLHNYAGEISLENHPMFENSAVSIRILRFADGVSG